MNQALLSGPAINALSLLKRTRNVNTDDQKWKDSFPKLFNGLGKIQSEYTIKLKYDAQPHAVTTPRRIAHPRVPKVRAEIERMGVISKIETPTE